MVPLGLKERLVEEEDHVNGLYFLGKEGKSIVNA